MKLTELGPLHYEVRETIRTEGSVHNASVIESCELFPNQGSYHTSTCIPAPNNDAAIRPHNHMSAKRIR